MTESYYVMAFDATFFAMQAEDDFKREKIKGRLIPTPAVISAGCGLSMRIEENDLVESLQRSRGLDLQYTLYRIVRAGRENTAQELVAEELLEENAKKKS